MNSPLRVGFLSFAHGHAAAYAHVMRDFSDVRLVSAWDADAARGGGVCAATGMRFHADPAGVLDDPEIDAVIIGSETAHHEAHVTAAARAGKHILLQKPMALDLAACDRMTEAAARAEVRLAMAFQMRHDPANQRIREIVHSGVLGDIAVARRRHCIGVCLMPEFVNGPSNWHLRADMNKGMFADDAAHPADWFHWIFGRPASVVAEIGSVITDCAPDDNGVAVYRFPSGMMGVLFNSSTVLAGENTTEIYGSKGCLIQNHGDGPSCSVPRPPDSPALKWFIYGEKDWRVEDIPIPPDQGHRIRAVPRPWVDAMLSGGPLPATAEDGRTALEMVLAAYHAAETGQRAFFPFA